MKKQLLSITAIVLTAGALVFTGCSKDDTTSPVVTLNGAENITISLNSAYTDLGATATDDKDGAITPTSTGSVNKDLTGTYIITYTATDAAGNEGTAKRTVIVKNDAEMYAGTYKCENPDFGNLSPWTQTITASKTKNNAIVFSQFAGRTGNTIVEAMLTGGTTFKVLDATVPNLGKNGCTYKYTPNGVGATITNISGKYTFSVKYFEEKIQGAAGVCDAVAATAFEDKCTQQ